MKTVIVLCAAMLLTGCGGGDKDRLAFDPGGLRSEHVTEAYQAVAQVREDTGVNVRIEPGGDSWFEYGPDPYFMAYVICYSDHCKMRFNSDLDWSDPLIFKWVAMHEFGHVAGLSHVCAPAEYMHDITAC